MQAMTEAQKKAMVEGKRRAVAKRKEGMAAGKCKHIEVSTCGAHWRCSAVKGEWYEYPCESRRDCRYIAEGLAT